MRQALDKTAPQLPSDAPIFPLTARFTTHLSAAFASSRLNAVFVAESKARPRRLEKLLRNFVLGVAQSPELRPHNASRAVAPQNAVTENDQVAEPGQSLVTHPELNPEPPVSTAPAAAQPSTSAHPSQLGKASANLGVAEKLGKKKAKKKQSKNKKAVKLATATIDDASKPTKVSGPPKKKPDEEQSEKKATAAPASGKVGEGGKEKRGEAQREKNAIASVAPSKSASVSEPAGDPTLSKSHAATKKELFASTEKTVVDPYVGCTPDDSSDSTAGRGPERHTRRHSDVAQALALKLDEMTPQRAFKKPRNHGAANAPVPAASDAAKKADADPAAKEDSGEQQAVQAGTTAADTNAERKAKETAMSGGSVDGKKTKGVSKKNGKSPTEDAKAADLKPAEEQTSIVADGGKKIGKKKKNKAVKDAKKKVPVSKPDTKEKDLPKQNGVSKLADKDDVAKSGKDDVAKSEKDDVLQSEDKFAKSEEKTVSIEATVTAFQGVDNPISEPTDCWQDKARGRKRRRSDASDGSRISPAPFKRVREEDVKFTDVRLRDNSFYSKEDSFGMKAHQDLVVTKGKGFRKEKTKKKRLNHHGGKLSGQVNSYKFPDDSD